MPTALLATNSYSMTDTPTNSTRNRPEQATIVAFEKRMDQKIWYTVKVEPRPNHQKRLTAYFIARRYEDFSVFSQKLHDRFSNTSHISRLPPKIKNRLNFLSAGKNSHAQRAEELNQFLSALFSKTNPVITESNLVTEFFKSDSYQRANLSCSNITHSYSTSSSSSNISSRFTDEEVSCEEYPSPHPSVSTSRWKRLRCTSFLAKAPPSTAGLSSLCSQAANRIIPSRYRNNSAVNMTGSPQPSYSTPVIPQPLSNGKTATTAKPASRTLNYVNNTRKILKKSKSTVYISDTVHPLSKVISITPQKDSVIADKDQQGTVNRTIKIKVIYDTDNIIVIQVPRTITLDDLQARIAQKFSDPRSIGEPTAIQFEKQFVLLFSDSNSSCSSIASSITITNQSSNLSDATLLPAILINKEQDLTQIMDTKWNRLEKVTLRCVQVPP